MAKSNKVSLTTFVDFVSKSGTPKITVVRRFKHGDAYRPALDFYKPVRDAIVDVHEHARPNKALDEIVTGLKDPRKLASFTAVVRGHKKWRTEASAAPPSKSSSTTSARAPWAGHRRSRTSGSHASRITGSRRGGCSGTRGWISSRGRRREGENGPTAVQRPDDAAPPSPRRPSSMPSVPPPDPVAAARAGFGHLVARTM